MAELMALAAIVLKTSLVLAAAGLLSVTVRRQSAAFRHVLWTTALALCVLMPAGALFLPSHPIATLPSHFMPAPLSIPSPASGGALGWGQVTSALLALWLIGTSIVLLRELVATIGLARWRRHASPLTSKRWIATLAAHGYDHRSLRVLESQQIASPCTWGVLRPVLLLPTSGDAWPESARHAALMHELAHIERRDAVTLLVARFACALHWYNPLVWLAAERIRSLQERACDDAVLRTGATPSDYAQFLVDVAARTSGVIRPTRSAIGMTHGSSLRARIVAILDPQAMHSRPRRTRVAAACASLFVFTILVATISVAVEPPPPPPTAPQPESPATPEPPVPAEHAIPSIPAIPAIPAIPPIPATPAIPAIPAIPATPKPPAGPTQ